MNAKKFFEAMTDYDLAFWWFQYGQARQACYYRNVPRRKAWAEMQRRGLAPLPLNRTPRPRGYGTQSGYLPNWGIL